MKRFKHSLAHYKLLTCDMGELVPVCNFEVLPGDSLQCSGSMLLRVSPLLAPVMHPVSARIHYWFVPYRLLWEKNGAVGGWEQFITGGADGEGEGAVYPTIMTPPSVGFPVGSLADYLGITPDVADLPVSAFPFRAYALIYNEMYRDNDLIAALPMSTAGGLDVTTSLALQKCAWEKDRFTGARPWPQKGPDVSLPLGVSAPVVAKGSGVPTLGGAALQTGAFNADGRVVTGVAGSLPGQNLAWTNPALEADLTNASAVNVNDVREAFALQRYQEARAQFGHRYSEYLRFIGVRPSDARLQRPEYLGGGKQVISFSEVLRTGSETAPADPEVAPIGEMKGHGIAAMRSRPYRRFMEEHGIVMGLMSVRPRTMYVDGLHRSWSKRTKEDFWQKELEHIGQEEVFSRELFAANDAAGGNTVFGYSNRYSDYSSLPSTVSGDFRSSLDFWHMARSFAAAPVLNQSFVECDPTKRIHAVQSEDVLWVMFNNKVHMRRMVSRGSGIGRIV